MKWIGQHIWDLISRFRSDVYLESIADHGSDPDRFLTMDSTTGKVSYRTGSEVASDIGAATLTQEQVEDYAGALVASGGTKTGISVTYQDGTGDMDFEVDHDAATNFVAAEHYRWDNDISGTATINANNIPTLNQNTTGVAAGLTASTSNSIGVGEIELGHANDTTIARSSSGVITVEGNTVTTQGASGSNLIILSAGNGYLSTITADEWYFGNNSYGHTYHNRNNVKAAITADDGTFTMSEDYNQVGRLIPAALSKVTLQVSARPAGGTSTGEVLSACIVSADRDGAGTNTTWTVLAQGTITQVQGEYDGVDITYTGSIATSKMLAIGVGSTESGSIGTTNVRFTYALTGYLA